MSRVPPPLRFLAVVLGGWAMVRGAMLAPGWWVETGRATPTNEPAAEAKTLLAAPAPERGGVPESADSRSVAPAFGRQRVRRAVPVLFATMREGSAPGRSPSSERLAPRFVAPTVPSAIATATPATVFLPRQRASRWSGAAWVLLRDEGGESALAPGGTLGGSQAGARILYRVNGDPERPLALSARLYLPLRRTQGAELAAGLDWRPFARLPLHVLVERRQAIGSEGRSAFGLTLYGGHSGRLPGGLGFDTHVQAGLVGLRSRDLFVDGSARVWAPVGRFQVGGAAWAAAQPGAERLDAGPQISYRLPVGRADLRLTADWRFRLAGDAAPGSGPAFTIASDF